MSEDKKCELFRTSRSSDHRKKNKKKKKKNTSSLTAAEKKAEELLSIHVSAETLSGRLLPSPHPDQTHLPCLGATCKNSEHRTGRGQKNKKHYKNSQTQLPTTPKTSEKPVKELSIQDWESLRWEGVLQNPQEEAKRLELYRANRRQRYIEHRQAVLKETQHTLR